MQEGMGPKEPTRRPIGPQWPDVVRQGGGTNALVQFTPKYSGQWSCCPPVLCALGRRSNACDLPPMCPPSSKVHTASNETFASSYSMPAVLSIFLLS